MCVYVCVRVCMCACVLVGVCLRVCLSACLRVCGSVGLRVCGSAGLRVSVCPLVQFNRTTGSQLSLFLVYCCLDTTLQRARRASIEGMEALQQEAIAVEEREVTEVGDPVARTQPVHPTHPAARATCASASTSCAGGGACNGAHRCGSAAACAPPQLDPRHRGSEALSSLGTSQSSSISNATSDAGSVSTGVSRRASRRGRRPRHRRRSMVMKVGMFVWHSCALRGKLSRVACCRRSVEQLKCAGFGERRTR